MLDSDDHVGFAFGGFSFFVWFVRFGSFVSLVFVIVVVLWVFCFGWLGFFVCLVVFLYVQAFSVSVIERNLKS